MTKGMHNYIYHVNTWWWGKTITLVSKDGYSTVELQFDDNYPSIAFIKGLSVFSTRRKEGYGTEIMGCCEVVAKKEGYTFLQLSVNKEQDWLVKWYKHLGFVIIMKDEHEFTMLKSLRPQNNITDEELAQAKKDAYNDALDKIEYHSGEPTFDDGWSAAIWYLKKKNAMPQTQWKPSDEQMADLWNMLCECRPAGHQLLQDIYYGLKKLKGE